VHSSPGADGLPTSNLEPETLNADVMHPVHNLHNETGPEIAATSAEPCTCVSQVRLDKNSIDACIIDCDQPSWPPTTQARIARDGHRREAVVAGSRVAVP